MNQSRFPEGWDEKRVQRVLAHYEGQTEEEAVAEDEVSFQTRSHSTVQVPVDLVPAVRDLIARHDKEA